MTYAYDDQFFDGIDAGARRSAKILIETGVPWLRPASVLDMGCGRGAWLAEWMASGVTDVTGVDGDYVDRARLYIPPDRFVAADLSNQVELGRRFDLVQSLEVAEHLAPEAAEPFIASLCRHADLVLFSAAVPGQGGENHINERPLSYWRELFGAHRFEAYDAVRPVLAHCRDVEPWYRYNSLLYANAAGAEKLPAEIAARRIEEGWRVPAMGDFAWKARIALVHWLPRPVVTGIARLNARARAVSPRNKS